jgi:hypothetical protein
MWVEIFKAAQATSRGSVCWAPTDDAEDRSVRFDTETNLFSVPLSAPGGCRDYVWWSREYTDSLRFELTAALATFRAW